jgi:hypothetical protein
MFFRVGVIWAKKIPGHEFLVTKPGMKPKHPNANGGGAKETNFSGSQSNVKKAITNGSAGMTVKNYLDTTARDKPKFYEKYNAANNKRYFFRLVVTSNDL